MTVRKIIKKSLYQVQLTLKSGTKGYELVAKRKHINLKDVHKVLRVTCFDRDAVTYQYRSADQTTNSACTTLINAAQFSGER